MSWRGLLGVFSERRGLERVATLACEDPPLELPASLTVRPEDYVPRSVLESLPSFALRLAEERPGKFGSFLASLADPPRCIRLDGGRLHLAPGPDPSTLFAFYGRPPPRPPPTAAAIPAFPQTTTPRIPRPVAPAEAAAVRPAPAPYAYVYTLFGGDAYVPGALVSAFSLKRAGTAADLVCLVTHDVTESARGRLRAVFHAVAEVDYLRVAVAGMRTPKQEERYGSWMDVSFTRWACLALTQYDKVLLLDADTLALDSLDDLFTLPCPAATFSSPWAEPYKRGGMANLYLDTAGTPLSHGDAVPSTSVAAALRHANSFVAVANCVLLAPEPGLYDEFCRFVRARAPFGLPNVNSGKDEQSLALFYAETRPEVTWAHIHQRYGFIPWHTAWLPEGASTARALHYFGEKPWALPRAAYDDLALWFSAAEALESVAPSLRGHLHIDGAVGPGGGN